MLEQILDKVKDFAQDAVSGSSDISDDKKGLAAQATTDTLVDGFKSFFADGNFLDKAKELLSGGGGDLFDKIKDNLGSALTKVGVDASSATNFATSIIPSLKETITSKFNLDSFNVSDVIENFTGKDASGGILSKLKSLFGGK